MSRCLLFNLFYFCPYLKSTGTAKNASELKSKFDRMIPVNRKGCELAQHLRNDFVEKAGIRYVRFPELLQRVNVFLEEVHEPKKGLDKLLPRTFNQEKRELWLSSVTQAIQPSARNLDRPIDCRHVVTAWPATRKSPYRQ